MNPEVSVLWLFHQIYVTLETDDRCMVKPSDCGVQVNAQPLESLYSRRIYVWSLHASTIHNHREVCIRYVSLSTEKFTYVKHT